MQTFLSGESVTMDLSPLGVPESPDNENKEEWLGEKFQSLASTVGGLKDEKLPVRVHYDAVSMHQDCQISNLQLGSIVPGSVPLKSVEELAEAISNLDANVLGLVCSQGFSGSVDFPSGEGEQSSLDLDRLARIAGNVLTQQTSNSATVEVAKEDEDWAQVLLNIQRQSANIIFGGCNIGESKEWLLLINGLVPGGRIAAFEETTAGRIMNVGNKITVRVAKSNTMFDDAHMPSTLTSAVVDSVVTREDLNSWLASNFAAIQTKVASMEEGQKVRFSQSQEELEQLDDTQLCRWITKVMSENRGGGGKAEEAGGGAGPDRFQKDWLAEFPESYPEGAEFPEALRGLKLLSSAPLDRIPPRTRFHRLKTDSKGATEDICDFSRYGVVWRGMVYVRADGEAFFVPPQGFWAPIAGA